jgi:anti-sigma regulatory factor (Ser/Thr protein kinase)
VKRDQDFPAEGTSVRAARAFAQDTLPTDLDPEDTGSIVLMVSELASNAVVHAQSSFRVTVEHTSETIRITVTDTGPGLPVRRTPPLDHPSGRGLHIVATLSDSWGVVEHADGKSVWFQMNRRPAPRPDDRETRRHAAPTSSVRPGRPPSNQRRVPKRSARRPEQGWLQAQSGN